MPLYLPPTVAGPLTGTNPPPVTVGNVGDQYRDSSGRVYGPKAATRVLNVTTRERTGTNTATLTTSAPHGLSIGDVVDVSVDGTGYNKVATYVTEVPSTTTLRYQSSGANEAATAASGVVMFAWSGAARYLPTIPVDLRSAYAPTSSFSLSDGTGYEWNGGCTSGSTAAGDPLRPPLIADAYLTVGAAPNVKGASTAAAGAAYLPFKNPIISTTLQIVTLPTEAGAWCGLSLGVGTGLGLALRVNTGGSLDLYGLVSASVVAPVSGTCAAGDYIRLSRQGRAYECAVIPAGSGTPTVTKFDAAVTTTDFFYAYYPQFIISQSTVARVANFRVIA